jgi:hypothetical protein
MDYIGETSAYHESVEFGVLCLGLISWSFHLVYAF